jgi:Flp pilus assembly CpaF family ATPase
MSHSPINIGPLSQLLDDEAIIAIHITEDMVNYEKAGVIHSSDIKFESDDQRSQIIDSIVTAGGGILSPNRPVVDCILVDGTQVHAEFHPLSLSLRKSV